MVEAFDIFKEPMFEPARLDIEGFVYTNPFSSVCHTDAVAHPMGSVFRVRIRETTAGWAIVTDGALKPIDRVRDGPGFSISDLMHIPIEDRVAQLIAQGRI